MGGKLRDPHRFAPSKPQARCAPRFPAVRGARRLWGHRSLQSAAGRHALDMVCRRYVSHYSRTSGRGPARRVAGTGYLRRARHWIVGENIAWLQSAGDLRSVIRAWLRSPSHRRILLLHRFRELGVGVVKSSPEGDERGLTMVANFGGRQLSGRLRPVGRRPRPVAVWGRKRVDG